MDNVRAMAVLHCVTNLLEEESGFPFCQLLPVINVIQKVTVVSKLHDDVTLLSRLHYLVGLQDMRVVELSQDSYFSSEEFVEVLLL